jgi:hypothetical protein
MNDKTLDSGISGHGSMKSIKIGENSCIHNAHPIKTAVVCDSVWYGKPENGHKYVVYRKHETTGEPTYSICVCKDDMWIPEIFFSGVFPSSIGIPIKEVGVPIVDEDEWIDLETAFQTYEKKPAVQDVTPAEESKNKEPEVTDMTCREYLQYCVDKREAEELKQKVDNKGIKNSIHKAMPLEPDPNRDAIKRINERLDDIVEYIDKRFLDNPAIEQNWKHIKDFTNSLLDRILELEKRVPYVIPDIPLVPNQPYQPYTPYPATPINPITPWYPTTPSVPNPWPYGPIISYSIPGVGTITSSIGIGTGINNDNDK